MAAPHFQSLPFPFPAALCVADWCHFGCQGGAAYARHQTPWKMCGQARGKAWEIRGKDQRRPRCICMSSSVSGGGAALD